METSLERIRDKKEKHRDVGRGKRSDDDKGVESEWNVRVQKKKKMSISENITQSKTVWKQIRKIEQCGSKNSLKNLNL